jgi:cytochrome b
VFAGVARAARQVLPFDTMGVSVAHDPEVPFEDFENARFSAYAAEGAAQVEEIGESRPAAQGHRKGHPVSAFTLFVVPSIYVLVAKTHGAARKEDAIDTQMEIPELVEAVG